MDSINPKAALKFGHIDSKFLGKTIPDIGQRVAHLCGPSPFMGAMVDQLKKAGMDPRHIITEAFD